MPFRNSETTLVNAGNSAAVGFAQTLERPAKLAVHVIDNSSPSGAWVLVGRNDLVADGSEGSGFIDRKKSPWSSAPAASHSRSHCGRGKGRL